MSDVPRPCVAELIACESCGSKDRDARGFTHGQRLIMELRAVLAGAAAPVTLNTAPCLWACERSCAVHLRGPERVGYVLCNLPANATTAEALVEYATLFAQSAEGAVPIKQRPEPLKGHFLCRIPKPAVPQASELPSGPVRRSEDIS